MSKENVLKVCDLTMQFGGVVAVNNLSMEVNKGEIIGLIGPNGAGKTTVFNMVTGVYAPTNGAIYLNDKLVAENHPHGKMKDIYNGLNAGKYTGVLAPTPDKITKMGVARTFQNIRLFKELTVFENVLEAYEYKSKYFFGGADDKQKRRKAYARRDDGASQDTWA